MMNKHSVEQTNRPDLSKLLDIVLKNIPAARRMAEAHRAGARQDPLPRVAS